MWWKKYTGLIGIGAMYAWACAIVLWVDWIKSDSLGAKAIGLLGAALVSLSMAAILIYASRQAARNAELERQITEYRKIIERQK